MKKLYLIILLAIFVYIAGCSTQSNDSSITTSTPTKPIRDIRQVNCSVFDAKDVVMGGATIYITYDSAKYSDGFLLDKKDTSIYADENGNFIAYLNRSVVYNFTVTEEHGFTPIGQQNPYSYSIILNPPDGGCILKPNIPTPQPTPTSGIKKSWGNIPSPEEFSKNAGEAAKWFGDFVNNIAKNV